MQSGVKHIFIIYFGETNLTAKYISYLKHTQKHTQNKWNSCLLSLKNTSPQKISRMFFFPIIYPNTASSETKQLEGEI